MAASIDFYAGEGFTINALAGSGLGFYGSAFGNSVNVGDYQDRTFITNSAGTAHGPEVDNCKYDTSSTVILGQGGSSSGAIDLVNLPNYQATLNIRFTYDSAVKVQNAALKIYDRSDPANSATGVTCQTAEIIHPHTSQATVGSGDTDWTTFTPADDGGVSMDLADSPGISGLYAGDGTTSVRPDTRHDWFVALSASPDSIGSKTLFGLYVSLEYL